MARIWNKPRTAEQSSLRGRRKVFVAMSGGVDSSVAALLLKRQGYDATGVFMKCYNIDGCAERDAEDARRVAEHLGIPFYVWDFEKEYKKKVVDYMIRGYKAGITPNPDVMCNREIKFGLFLEKALKLGANYVATGHYVRLCPSTNNEYRTNQRMDANNKMRKDSQIRIPIRYSLMVAKDTAKDQSYFLWTLTQKQLAYCLFPIGDYIKSEVREIARRARIPTADKKDSQGICFLGKFSVADFLKKHIRGKRGPVLDLDGRKIGEHDGSQFYTIGQRHGIVATSDKKHATWMEKTNGKNRKNSLTSHFSFNMSHKLPFYVATKNAKDNTLTVAEGDDNPALYKKEIILTDVNIVNPNIASLIRANSGIKVWARVRYRQPLAQAELRVINARNVLNVGNDSDSKSRLRQAQRSTRRNDPTLKLVFNAPVKFVAPGQSAVFYDKKGAMLGGGIFSAQ